MKGTNYGQKNKRGEDSFDFNIQAVGKIILQNEM